MTIKVVRLVGWGGGGVEAQEKGYGGAETAGVWRTEYGTRM